LFTFGVAGLLPRRLTKLFLLGRQQVKMGSVALLLTACRHLLELCLSRHLLELLLLQDCHPRRLSMGGITLLLLSRRRLVVL